VKLSVVIPARNEDGCIERTVRQLTGHLASEGIDHEILIVDDHSTDYTGDVVLSAANAIPTVRPLKNPYAPGVGLAVRWGLENFTGDAVAIYMADASDSPADLVLYWRTMLADRVDCVFGSRFIEGGGLTDYPLPKLVLNRITNQCIRFIFGLRYNDITNAFKLYHRRVIDGIKPILSHHFNITVELPLKSIIRGYTYAVVPNHWTNRKAGESKLRIKEMGSRYAFIILYCAIEKWLSRGDYHRAPEKVITRPEERDKRHVRP
jgi:dolichol-phosphate mannosyltransferase